MKISVPLASGLLAASLMTNSPSLVRADVLSVCVIQGEGVTARVERRIEAGAIDLLRMLERLLEPSGYDVYAPGETVNATGAVRRRATRALPPPAAQPEGANANGAASAIVDTAIADTDAAGAGRALQVKTCPSACSKSGGNYCRSMGCAYCGRCRRRRLLRTLTVRGSRSRSLRGDLSLADAVELALGRVLSLYCLGVPGCKLRAEILTVSEDGTLTEAAP